MDKFLLISVGAIFGANLRYWVGDWAAQKFGTSFPYGTLIINFTGCLLIGFFLTLATERLMIDAKWRLLLSVGFLGAYTTFSTYAYESLSLLTKGQWLAGSINVFGSTFLGLLGVWIGVYLAKLI